MYVYVPLVSLVERVADSTTYYIHPELKKDTGWFPEMVQSFFSETESYIFFLSY